MSAVRILGAAGLAVLARAACPAADCGCDWATDDTCQSNPTSTCGKVCCCRHYGEEEWRQRGGTDEGTGGGGDSQDPVVSDDDGTDEWWEGLQAATTRYWDCCKPSCTWPGKADIAPGFTSVKSCYENGEVADPNAISGCGGGGFDDPKGVSFSCPNNQPWIAENGVLYGFSASGGGDKECCTCYELEFLDRSVHGSRYEGQLEGQRMVVQVTNVGYDLESKHFDIQIPGSGFGLYNGCAGDENDAPQFPNSNPSNWGQRYGGVNNAAACDKLPAALREGCRFRFLEAGFRDADNPAVKYRKVRCPASLVAISGCRLASEVAREVSDPVDGPAPTPPPVDNAPVETPTPRPGSAPVETPTPRPGNAPFHTPTPQPSYTGGCTVGLHGDCTNAGDCCRAPNSCYRQSQWYSQCLAECPGGNWDCADEVETTEPPTSAATQPPSPAACYGHVVGSQVKGKKLNKSKVKDVCTCGDVCVLDSLAEGFQFVAPKSEGKKGKCQCIASIKKTVDKKAVKFISATFED